MSKFFEIRDIDGTETIVGVHDQHPGETGDSVIEATVPQPYNLLGMAREYLFEPPENRPNSEEVTGLTVCQKIMAEAQRLYNDIRFLNDFDDRIDTSVMQARYEVLQAQWVDNECEFIYRPMYPVPPV